MLPETTTSYLRQRGELIPQEASVTRLGGFEHLHLLQACMHARMGSSALAARTRAWKKNSKQRIMNTHCHAHRKAACQLQFTCLQGPSIPVSSLSHEEGRSTECVMTTHRLRAPCQMMGPN